MRSYCLELPWPPSTNAYWTHLRHRVKSSDAVKAYRNAVVAALVDQAAALDDWTPGIGDRKLITGRMAVVIIAVPPDKRERDLDNMLKAPLDALESAGVYANDAAIDFLQIVRADPEKPGRLIVTITRVKGDPKQ